MSMTQSGNVSKKCATCQYFGGTREVVSSGRGVRHEANSFSTCVGGSKNGRKIQVNNKCPGYVKWAALK